MNTALVCDWCSVLVKFRGRWLSEREEELTGELLWQVSEYSCCSAYYSHRRVLPFLKCVAPWIPHQRRLRKAKLMSINCIPHGPMTTVLFFRGIVLSVFVCVHAFFFLKVFAEHPVSSARCNKEQNKQMLKYIRHGALNVLWKANHIITGCIDP